MDRSTEPPGGEPARPRKLKARTEKSERSAIERGLGGSHGDLYSHLPKQYGEAALERLAPKALPNGSEAELSDWKRYWREQFRLRRDEGAPARAIADQRFQEVIKAARAAATSPPTPAAPVTAPALIAANSQKGDESLLLDKEWVSVPHAMEYLGVTRRTIERKVKDEYLIPDGKGQNLRISTASLRKELRRRRDPK